MEVILFFTALFATYLLVKYLLKKPETYSNNISSDINSAIPIKDDRNALLKNYEVSVENHLPTVQEKKVTPINSSLSFVAIDFETANKSYDSACSLGIAVIKNGQIIETKHWLIRPPRNYFEFTHLHNISWNTVKNEGDFGELWPQIQPYLVDEILVAHNAFGFDMRVLQDLVSLYDLSFEPFVVWDTLELAKKTWDLPNYKLDTVCKHLGIELNHHNAESDAVAAAWVAMHSMNQKELKPIKSRVNKKVTASTSKINRVRKPRIIKNIDFDETTLDGNTIVFTGDLDSMSRDEAIESAQDAGAIIKTSVSQKTNFLVVGSQTNTTGIYSSKELKAKELISQGHNIVILTEDEFLEMIDA